MVKYKTIKQFAAESGYTEAAVRAKIRDRVWPEGLVWIQAPDGKKLISIDGYNSWAEMGMTGAAFNRPPTIVLKSRSNIRGNGAGKELHSSPPPLI